MNDQASTELLTPQQAADVLNVSMQWLRKLQGDGTLVAVEVDGGEHLLSADVLAYKAERDARRRAGLEKLVSLTEEMGLYEHQRERALGDER